MTDQLFDLEPQAVTRRTDPQTSHEAAASVTKIRETQRSILKVLKAHGPQTGEQIARHYRLMGLEPRQSSSGLRTRRSELVELGKVRDSGEKRKLVSGRKAIVWEVVGG